MCGRLYVNSTDMRNMSQFGGQPSHLISELSTRVKKQQGLINVQTHVRHVVRLYHWYAKYESTGTGTIPKRNYTQTIVRFELYQNVNYVFIFVQYVLLIPTRFICTPNFVEIGEYLSHMEHGHDGYITIWTYVYGSFSAVYIFPQTKPTYGHGLMH